MYIQVFVYFQARSLKKRIGQNID